MSARSVVIVHGERMLAEGLAAALRAFSGVAVAAVATSVEEGLAAAHRADAVAIDVDLPDALRAAADLRRNGVRAVLFGCPDGIDGAEEAGLCVPTTAPIARLAMTLVPGSVVPRRPSVLLSPREREVLRLVADGLAAKQVARQLGISVKTIEHHKSRIYRKLGAPNQAAAVSIAQAEGLV